MQLYRVSLRSVCKGAGFKLEMRSATLKGVTKSNLQWFGIAARSVHPKKMNND